MIYFRVRMEETSRFAAAKQPAPISITSAPTHTHPLSPSTYHATTGAQGEGGGRKERVKGEEERRLM
jgi:hypothetical protein